MPFELRPSLWRPSDRRGGHLAGSDFYYRRPDSRAAHGTDNEIAAKRAARWRSLARSVEAPERQSPTPIFLQAENPMNIWKPAASFTRPDDTIAYAVGDLVVNSTMASSVAPLSFRRGR